MDDSNLLKASAALCLFGTIIVPTQALAVTCQVPLDRPTIQTAVNDPTCTDVILQNQIYPESVVIRRNVLVFGPQGGSAVIRGAIKVEGSAVFAMLADFSIENGCSMPGLSATQSAEIQAESVAVESSAQFDCDSGDVFLSDGFE